MQKRVGQYLMDAIRSVGVDKVFGVPGDFNLTFLDDIINREDMEWIGNTNELNASYAADGYARIKGISAMVTTFGVGELSAVNGIAGAYAERVPVIAITGAPTREVERAGKYVHHSLGEGTFDDYRKMYKHITTAQGYITPENSQTEIPRLINAAINEKRPVHIHLPIDVAAVDIEVETPYQYTAPAKQDVDSYIEIIENKLKNAKQPLIITGHEINSFALHDKLEQFVNQTHIPVAQLSLGKGAFNEENQYYMGIYDGKIADEQIKAYVDQSDVILNIGAKLTDSATAGFSYGFNLENVIMMNHHYFKVDELRDEEVKLVDLLDSLLNIDYTADVNYPRYQVTNETVELSDEPLKQSTYFKLMQQFIQPQDVILAEQGTSFFGAYDLLFSKDNTFIGQPLWGSIGYTLPATLGTQIADKQRRNVLLIGDGSLQLTVQALSTIIREALKPVIFVINNDGYTVERKIHGETALYNDIKMWNYKQLPFVFGMKETDVQIHDVTTSNTLATALDEINQNPNIMHFVEVHMDVHDAPEKLDAIGKAFAQQNG
ncbi:MULTISPECIES: alpha-keto acid decarboxylase family protein [Staphylococcus]|uniref:alpha-keto acid decarboxylase family protein n=1 Tax=Staphylococcus TaxID=1279 RepID=UPI00193A9BAC|nr:MULTISPECIES: alpha-keto acid decarboxylase family protein [Staphylococcus]MDU9348409.1 alpha-keto acid decarboxylase family protein [Staphylococcus ureilyticus]QQV53176.1 alpha-keto acid decarboxylase family protein [Staphylococcus sp. 11-B-312]